MLDGAPVAVECGDEVASGDEAFASGETVASGAAVEWQIADRLLQRALKLTPGPHKVTLVNKQYGISESFTVTAKAGAPVKVVKDLTAKMRR